MRPLTMIYFERLCLAASLALELEFFIGWARDTQLIKPGESMAGQFIGIGLCLMLTFVFLTGIPYWLSLWAARRKSRIAAILLYGFFALSLLGLAGSLVQHGIVHADTMLFFVNDVLLAGALVCYWAPESRDWLRRDEYGAIRRA